MPSRAVVRYIQKSKDEGGLGTIRQRERIIQRALTRRLNQDHPEIDFFNDWASGAFLTHGQNMARDLLSCRNGWVDMFFAEPRRGYHGLFIELKKEDTKIFLKDGLTLRADPQIRKEYRFIERQRKKGYKAEFACGMDEAWKIICEYFDWPHELENEQLVF